MSDSKTRFTDRVQDYSRYRPGYPDAVFQYLRHRFTLDPESVVADIGSGTGLFTEPLLKMGCSVAALEPNDAMRAESDRLLSHYPGYTSYSACAESTTLPAASVQLVVAAQAFHWFDPAKAVKEFTRICKDGGGIALIWNRRDDQGSEFLGAYETMLKNGVPKYNDVSHKSLTDAQITSWLGADEAMCEFDNSQVFDFEGLRGRLSSSSYCPKVGSPEYTSVMKELGCLFDRYSVNGKVPFLYKTQVYVAQL